MAMSSLFDLAGLGGERSSIVWAWLCSLVLSRRITRRGIAPLVR